MHTSAKSLFCFHCMVPLPALGASCPHCSSNNSEVENLPNQLPCGTVLDRKYLIGRVLGQGGFGIMYIGLDLMQQEKVGIKEFYPIDSVTREMSTGTTVLPISDNARTVFEARRTRFMEEASVLSRLSVIPNVAGVRNCFAENGSFYSVMKYREGETLKSICAKRGKLPAKEAMQLLAPIMQSLAKVHEADLLHCEIYPGNILMQSDGEAVLIGLSAVNTMSESNKQSVGTIAYSGYSAPELYASAGKLGPWTDVYSLCAILYWLTTGRRPPSSLDISMDSHLLIPPNELGADLSKAQQVALLKGMSVDPEKRQQDVMTLLRQLLPRTNKTAAISFNLLERLRTQRPT